jgi:6-phosphogluconolactonase (cycloisomerase 2 family)
MEPYDTGHAELASYGIWNKEVVAPASGMVVAAYDEEEDILPNTEEFKSAEGNHVYIKMDASGTYLLLNHFKKDSLTVRTGDHVNKGEVVGHVGNSGSTSEPHLHIHHQRQDPTKVAFPIFAEGLPLYFEGTDAQPMPVKGTRVMLRHGS